MTERVTVAGDLGEVGLTLEDRGEGRPFLLLHLLHRYLAAGLVDEFTLTIAPVLLGAAKRLFDGMERTDNTSNEQRVIESLFATHLRFHVC